MEKIYVVSGTVNYTKQLVWRVNDGEVKTLPEIINQLINRIEALEAEVDELRYLKEL